MASSPDQQFYGSCASLFVVMSIQTTLKLPILELLIVSKMWLDGHVPGMEGDAGCRKYFENLKYFKRPTWKTISGLRIMQC